MKYFIDTEFLEGTQNKTILGIKYSKTKPTIDLISIGLVSEDSREYYAISKDFNLKEAWNRWQQRTGEGDRNNIEPRLYWLRENVLKPIYKELHSKENLHARQAFHRANVYIAETKFDFTYKNLKKLIEKYGKTNKQIAEEIKEFVCSTDSRFDGQAGWYSYEDTIAKDKPHFYAYYADYDWVAFCWLFGKMMDLPKGFPMYCIDLKQTLDVVANKFNRNDFFTAFDFLNEGLNELTLEEKIKHIKLHVSYPKQTDEHNALSDAKWNKQLHEFLNQL